MQDMMLRSNKILRNISAVAAKRARARYRQMLDRSHSKEYIEGRESTKEHSNSVLHCGTGLCQALCSCSCFSVVAQSSVAEHISVRQLKNTTSTEEGKCSSAVPPSSTSKPVMNNTNESTDLQPTSVSEDRDVVPSNTSSPQLLNNNNLTEALQPSSVSEDRDVVPSNISSPQALTNPADLQPSSVSEELRTLEMEDSIVEISDVSVLEIKSHKPSSSDKMSTDAETSDIIIISDSPGKGSVGNNDLKTTSHEVPRLKDGRKRKISDESGVEILCDNLGTRPKKQQKMESAIKEKKLRTDTTIKENFTVTVSDADRKISQLSKNVKSKNVVNITSKQSSGDGDDIIFISAEDDEVSVIKTNEHKPSQEDVIILDSPPAQTSVQRSHRKAKKNVSASTSVTGLIPHYTQNLIDYISLDGKPPATIPSSSTSAPLLPAGSSDTRTRYRHIPGMTRAHSPRQRRKHRPTVRNRLLNDGKHTSAVQPDNVPVSACPSHPHELAENQISTDRNSTQNSLTQHPSTRNSSTQFPLVQNSSNRYPSTQISSAQNSSAQNSSTRHPSAQNSMARHPSAQNSAARHPSAQNPSARHPSAQNSSARHPSAQNSSARHPSAQNSSARHPSAENSSAQNSSAQNSSARHPLTLNAAHENSVQSTPEVPQSPACDYGNNIYNPNAGDKEEAGLRPIIIDGNNIAMGHGKGKCFSWRGVHICIKYFLKRGHKVTAFVPTFRRGNCPPELRSELEEYERSGQVVFTPSRRIDGRLIVPYDDRFIVQCAAELGGVIVSTDNYRDLLSENSSWKETIEKRLLMFTWVGDLLMFPHDPLGKSGPQLEEFLRFPKKE